ncbi:MAG: Fe-S-binding domain-containing protein [Actinobacteria bacterium]|nr:MAG: Fe-S-binding domain-containing protein [Actinomycetota bacterium]
MTVEVSVDGRTVVVNAGQSVLDACRAAGAAPPTLCYLDGFVPAGACRLCVVEVEGERRLAASCARPAQDGMVVRTESARVQRSRRLVLELLAGSTDVTRGPELMAELERAGADPGRFGAVPVAAAIAAPPRLDNDLYVRDMARCVLCYRCVQACGDEAQHTYAIAVAGRGFDAKVACESDVDLTNSACVYCGNCVGVCPTGALIGRREFDMRAAGEWDESRQHQTDTICGYCGVGCTVTLHTQDNRIVKVTSPFDHEVAHGQLCIKGRFGWRFIEE